MLEMLYLELRRVGRGGGEVLVRRPAVMETRRARSEEVITVAWNEDMGRTVGV